MIKTYGIIKTEKGSFNPLLAARIASVVIILFVINACSNPVQYEPETHAEPEYTHWYIESENSYTQTEILSFAGAPRNPATSEPLRI
jgi:hypothetical protein